ncbi:hypothetical protein PYW07_010743 [Mythimna separata]|uniref:Uncharacterized protein n=1 Tax=Mythimna separata TaxID=271217 RepID=A0AAD7Y7U7_MYTSE|nr:hypothetical protein PYW07_010743 [Mythimna separata]
MKVNNMMKVQIIVTEKIFCIMLMFVVFILHPITCMTVAEAMIDAPTEDSVQQLCEICGCEGMYVYDTVENRCVISYMKVMRGITVVYVNNKYTYNEDDELFKGILISAILFMACASICVISACVYCCRINYTDRIMENQIKDLAKKLKRDSKSAMSESCSVYVDPAGVFVA